MAVCCHVKQPLAECTNAPQLQQQPALACALKAHPAVACKPEAVTAVLCASQQQHSREAQEPQATALEAAAAAAPSLAAVNAQPSPAATAAADGPVLWDMPPSSLLGVTRRMAYVRVPKSLVNAGGSSSSWAAGSAKQQVSGWCALQLPC